MSDVGGQMSDVSRRSSESAPNSEHLTPNFHVETPRFDVVNLGGGNRPITINAMIALIEQQLGKNAVINRRPSNSADIKETWADIGKAKRLLGWTPQISPEEGFRKAVAWYLENQSWLVDIRL